GTGPSDRELRRLHVEGVEVVLVVGVFGSVAGALGRLMLEEVTVRSVRARGVAPQLERAGAQHEREQVRRDGAADGIRLREHPGPHRPTAAQPATPTPERPRPENRTCDKTSPWQSAGHRTRDRSWRPESNWQEATRERSVSRVGTTRPPVRPTA